MNQPINRAQKPWTTAVLDMLEDGAWTDYEKVVEHIGPLVPAKVAYEKAEWYRQYHFKRNGEPVKDRTKGSRQDTIETGRRLMIGISVQALRKSNRVEVEYATPNGQRRKRPSRVRRLK